MPNQTKTAFDPVEDALGEIAKGNMVIVTDDESRENEGDLVMAASKATPQSINHMILHARGLICVPLLSNQLSRLGISSMVPHNREIQNLTNSRLQGIAQCFIVRCSDNTKLKTCRINCRECRGIFAHFNPWTEAYDR